MIMKNSYLEEHLERFLQVFLSVCMQELERNRLKYDTNMKMPVLKNDRLVGIKQQNCVNYGKLVHDLKSQIKLHPTVYPLFKIVKNILEQKIKTITNKSDLDLDVNVLAEEQMFHFVLQYLKKKSEYDPVVFRETLSRFCQHLDEDLFSGCYLVPLYDMEGNFSKIYLSENIWIRRIKPEELAKIANIPNLPFREIPLYKTRLKFVMVYRIAAGDKTDSKHKQFGSLLGSADQQLNREDSGQKFIALEHFERITNSLRLFKDGNSQLGDLYWLASENWNARGLQLIERKHEPYLPYDKVILESAETKAFVLFHTNLHEKLGKDNFGFVDLSIRRFGMAFRHRNEADSAIDYVISLEALLVSGPGEATLKLAHRVAAISGKSDKNRLYLWQFMKEAYKFRSGILHEAKKRSFKINSESLDLKKVLRMLREISRDAIFRTIELLDTYPKQTKIINELDKCMYDRELLHNLEKIWAKSIHT